MPAEHVGFSVSASVSVLFPSPKGTRFVRSARRLGLSLSLIENVSFKYPTANKRIVLEEKTNS